MNPYTNTTASITLFGDVLEVQYDGRMWIAPTCGARFARPSEALAVELRAYFAASDDTTDHINGKYVRTHYTITRE